MVALLGILVLRALGVLCVLVMRLGWLGMMVIYIVIFGCLQAELLAILHGL